ncbi:MAG TPA: SpoIIE family protein phosphatase [Methanospirillum sp.]|nr:SpoIIE family protein phosphatase [Methanospirillum sp.]
MIDLIINVGFELFQIICVITLGSYFIIRTGPFNRVLGSVGSIRDKFLLILFFGMLSIYGTMSNIVLFGSPANVRDLGPICAGLTFGPWIGIGSAIIGATFRYSLGGITVIPCTLTTLISGLLAGFVWIINKKRVIGKLSAIFFILCIEIIHFGLILFIAGDGPEVMSILENMWVIMLPLYIIGILIYSLVFQNYITEVKNREELERKQVELMSAQEIQKSFLPDLAPVVPGYSIYAQTISAREVGGDFYDYISFDDDRFGFVIADVSGKSVPAALFMALSCTMVRVSSQWVQRPDLAAEQVNKLIARYADSGMFFSMFYGVITPKDGVVNYVNAGHPPPIIFREKGSFDEIHLTGSIIGFMEHQVFREATFTLFRGDLLLSYTDGVTEARRSDGEMFGKERLYNVVDKNRSKSAKEIVDIIMGEIRAFVDEEPQYDDITLLTIKREEP